MMHRPFLLPALVVGLALAAAPAAQAAGPAIGAAWSTEVAARTAVLHAEIDPGATTAPYHFSYLTEAAYRANLQAGREGFAGAAKAPAGADPVIGPGPVTVKQSLAALAPQTAYRYRVLAGAALGAAHAFATESLGGGPLLLDGRGWELVSPVDKNGGEIQGFGANFGGDVLQAAAGGEAVTFSSRASFGAGAQGAPVASQYLARRGPGGWSTENITEPTLAGAYGDQPNGVPYQLFSADLARGLILNGRRCAAGEECPRSYSLRDSESGALAPSPQAPGLRFVGASPDLRHVVLSTCAALTPEAIEVTSGGGGCDPETHNLYEWQNGALQFINGLSSGLNGPFASLPAQLGAVSADGTRVYWTQGTGAAFLHQGSTNRHVIEGGQFQTATPDGSLAYYIKDEHLVIYDALTQGTEEPFLAPSGEGAGFGGLLGLLGVSDDGSYIYYVGGNGALYLRHDGEDTYIAAAAAPGDYPPTTGTARLSADGSHLAFLSKASLTGYDNTDQKTGEPDTELYLYSAGGGGGGTLICASCNPTGERPLGPSTIPGAISNGSQPGATQAYEPRNLSADGARLFFDSRDALVLQDTDNAPDAYEWEAQGLGSCAAPGGCLALISSGRDAEPSTFVDASADGSDAFFLTAASLVPADPGSADLYDAREGGGFPQPPAPIPCEGDACQSLPPEPEDPAPGSLQPNPGNPPLRFHRARSRRHHHHRRKHHRHRGGHR